MGELKGGGRNKDDHIVVGENLVSGREKAVAASNLKLTLLRRRGFSPQKA